MTGFNRRFAPFTEKAQEFFHDRTEAMMLNIRINAGFIPGDHWTHQHGGRIVGELCHFVDWARAIVGRPIAKVSAAKLPNAGRYHDDNLTATLTFADGSWRSYSTLQMATRVYPKSPMKSFAVAR